VPAFAAAVVLLMTALCLVNPPATYGLNFGRLLIRKRQPPLISIGAG